MVVFWPSTPDILQVISTVPLTADLISLFQHDFNLGSFAQFGDPLTVARIDHRSERTDFRNMSHLAIRQQLDAENLLYDFLLIDEHTAQNHAVWYEVTIQDSEDTTADSMDIFGVSPVSYPGESFVLWQSHILIQDIAYDYDSIAAAEYRIYDMIAGGRVHPYDPHDPQEPPFDEGFNFTREGRTICPPQHSISATFSEVIYTDNPNITRYKGSKWAVGLTREAAKLSGMLSPESLNDNPAGNAWYLWEKGGRSYDRPPQPGDEVNLYIGYDWNSPRWPPPGVAGPFPGPTGLLSLASQIGRHPNTPTFKSPRQCVRRKLARPRLALPSVAISR